MKTGTREFALLSVITLLIAGVSYSEGTYETISYLPDENVEQFIVDRLNITTFRNSFGSARRPGMCYFADMGLAPTEISDGTIVFDTESWYYCIEVVEQADVNKDGIEDLVITFLDDSNGGTYLTQYLYLLVCFSEESDLIAIAYGPSGNYSAESDPAMKEGIIVPWSEQPR